MVKMDDGLPIVGPSVDLSQTPALNQKRILAFVNHFVSHTVRFLNKFSASCEQKLADIQTRIQRLEITLNILEAKLSSIPGLENITASAADSADRTNAENKSTVDENADAEKKADVKTNESDVVAAETSEPVAEITMTVSKDPRFARFFKMVLVGVPVPAVKTKMAAEGLNPDILDNPDAPAPGGGNISNDDDDGSSSEASSFSDSD